MRVATHLLQEDLVAVAQFVRCGCCEAGQGRGLCRAAQTTQLKLGRQLDNHDTEAVAKVQRHVANLAARDNDIGARGVDGLDLVLQQVLFALGVRLELSGRVQQHSALQRRGKRKGRRRKEWNEMRFGMSMKKDEEDKNKNNKSGM